MRVTDLGVALYGSLDPPLSNAPRVSHPATDRRNTMLNLSPAEAKVMDACNNDKWGPSGTIMHEICDYTRYPSECEDVLNILFMKLEETGRNWRMCYKALSCIEFMVRLQLHLFC